MKRLFRPRQRTLWDVPIVLLGGIGSSVASIIVFGKLSEEVLERESLALDTTLVRVARKTHDEGLDKGMFTITAAGEPGALAIVSGLASLWWLKENRIADVATLLLGALGGSAINQVLKRGFRRKRPTLRLRRAHTTGYSYPSGHAMTTLAAYGTLAFLLGRHGSLTKHPQAELVWIPTLVLCCLIGWSRVYLEVHYPTDVIGGWAVGTIWLTTCAIARSSMEPEES
jgi:membrane-associated phospholipid phosphatase